MKFLLILISVFALCGCSSEKSETTSSSDFVYGFETLSIIINPDFGDNPNIHIRGNIKLLGSGSLSLSDNDQLNLISPAGHLIKGVNTTMAYSSALECCNLAGIDNRTLAETQDNNTWQVVFKRQGIVEDSFFIEFPAPIDIENPKTLSVSPEQNFILNFSGTHSAGALSIKMNSTCFEADTGISQELKASDNRVTIPLHYIAGCEDPDANILIRYSAKAKTNTTTDLLNALITGTPLLEQHIELPLKIN